MPKMTSQENNPDDALNGGGLKEPSDLAVSPTGSTGGGNSGVGGDSASKGGALASAAKGMGGGNSPDLAGVGGKLLKPKDGNENKSKGEEAADKVASEAARVAATTATGGVPFVGDAAAELTNRIGAKRIAKGVGAIGIAILLPFVFFGFLIAYILNGGAWDALRNVMTDKKTREFVITTAGNWAETKGMPSLATDIAADLSNLIGVEDGNTANAAEIAGIKKPEPGSFEEKISKIDWAKAQFRYQGESKNDCSYDLKLQKRIFADGVVRSIPDQIINKSTGAETPISEIGGNAAAGYCIAQKYPLFNMLWRQPAAREINKKADIALSYAAPKDSPDVNTSPADTKKYVRSKTLDRVTTKKDAEKTITFESYKPGIDTLTKLYEEARDTLPDIKSDKLNNPKSSDNLNVQEGIDKMYQAMKDGTDPYDINVGDYISIPQKDSAPNGSKAEKEAVKLNLARTICPFSWGFNDTSTDEGKKNARLAIEARLTGAQRGSVKNVTLTDTRQADALNNSESNASITQNDSWASSTAYSLDVYNTTGGVQLNPEATHNRAYNAKKDGQRADLVFENIRIACDDIANVGFFERIGIGAGDNFNNAYKELKDLIIEDSPPSVKSSLADIGMEQIISAFMRTGSNTGVSGLEPGPDNYNRQSMGYRQLINDYTIATGGRFLSEAEAKDLALRADNMDRQTQRERGIAYRLFDTKNINSLASIFQHNTLTPNTTKTALIGSLKSLLDPLRSLANIHSNLSFYLSGVRNKAFAADSTGDQYFAIDTAGFTPQELALDPQENYKFIEEIKKGTTDENKADQVKFTHYDACFKMKIASKTLLAFDPGTTDFKYYPLKDDGEPESEYTKMNDCKFVLVDAKDLKDKAQEKAIRYRLYTYYNYQMDYLTKLSSDESDESIYANGAGGGGAAATATSTAGGAIVGNPYAETMSVSCAPGTVDIGPQDAYLEGVKTQSRMCSVSNIPSVGKSDNPGGEFSTAGADGHVVVNSRVSGAWYKLAEDAKAAGINLKALSSFRSMASQESLWAQYGRDTSRVARPGFSPHQAGVAIDFDNMSGYIAKASCSNRATNPSPAYQWLRANSVNYGFKQYAAEAWHWDALPSANRCGP
jgi:hypothetical protein